MKLAVPADAAGERLDRFLATHLGSRGAAERAVELGALVDGIARAKSYRLEGGEEVELSAAAPAVRRGGRGSCTGSTGTHPD